MNARKIIFAAVLAAAAGAGLPSNATAAAATCGSSLGASDAQRIVALSDTTTIRGSTPFEQLEDIVDRNDRLTKILVDHHDRRGLFSVGLDAVEDVAVMPLQRAKRFNDPDYAQRISRDLAKRWLDSIHAEFTGGSQSYQWKRFFQVTRVCGMSDARVAMVGYSAHLTVDLPRTIAQVGSTPADAEDYFKIVDAIASNGPEAEDRTTAAYGRDADFEPLWTAYWVGDIADAVTAPRVGSAQVTRGLDLSANVVLWNNGLALQDPAARPGVEGAIRTMWNTGDTAFEVIEQAGGL